MSALMSQLVAVSALITKLEVLQVHTLGTIVSMTVSCQFIAGMGCAWNSYNCGLSLSQCDYVRTKFVTNLYPSSSLTMDC